MTQVTLLDPYKSTEEIFQKAMKKMENGYSPVDIIMEGDCDYDTLINAFLYRGVDIRDW